MSNDSAHGRAVGAHPGSFSGGESWRWTSWAQTAVLDKVVGPDMIAVLRAQPNARSIGQPEPAALGLLWGTFSPSRRQLRLIRLSLISSPPGAAARRPCESRSGRIAGQAR